ncbi:MAG: polysaccharide deacetylase family protein [Candidatus Methanofastidiosa archaeon]|nr:polysaccharide deacetylase family protein [Candidatus Methanofastidiosa archaeon]
MIYFHSVGPLIKGWRKYYLTCSVNDAERFFRYISLNYRTIHLKEYWEQINGHIPWKKKQIVLTFDDGYLDNWLYAYPLLVKYNLKATIFISPEFVDPRDLIRHNISESGFLSWNEMSEMERSGLIDIQSHTLTHTKYFVSDKLRGFHHPGADFIYTLGNINSEFKPFYINDPTIERKLPYGFPFFEEKSSLIARKVEINPAFIEKCISIFCNYDFNKYNFKTAYKIAEKLYNEFKSKNEIITKVESDNEHEERILSEIVKSKKIIEQKLNKKVEFLCWPHGDNNALLHKIALDSGYLMTTIGKCSSGSFEKETRIPSRLGIKYFNSFNKIKTIFKLKALSGDRPYAYILGKIRQFRYKG